MNDTGNIPFWDLNPASALIAGLVVVVIIVCVLAWIGGRS